MDNISNEELLDELKKKVSLRNQMGGALYWNVVNDECEALKQQCRDRGIEPNLIHEAIKQL